MPKSSVSANESSVSSLPRSLLLNGSVTSLTLHPRATIRSRSSMTMMDMSMRLFPVDALELERHRRNCRKEIWYNFCLGMFCMKSHYTCTRTNPRYVVPISYPRQGPTVFPNTRKNRMTIKEKKLKRRHVVVLLETAPLFSSPRCQQSLKIHIISRSERHVFDRIARHEIR